MATMAYYVIDVFWVVMHYCFSLPKYVLFAECESGVKYCADGYKMR